MPGAKRSASDVDLLSDAFIHFVHLINKFNCHQGKKRTREEKNSSSPAFSTQKPTKIVALIKEDPDEDGDPMILKEKTFLSPANFLKPIHLNILDFYQRCQEKTDLIKPPEYCALQDLVLCMLMIGLTYYPLVNSHSQLSQQDLVIYHQACSTLAHLVQEDNTMSDRSGDYQISFYLNKDWLLYDRNVQTAETDDFSCEETFKQLTGFIASSVETSAIHLFRISLT